MTNRDAIKLAKRVEAWQKRLAVLGVAHWRILSVNVVEQPPGDESALAAVQTSESYDACTFWFKADYVDEVDERELDETIVHEWLHVAMRDHDVAAMAMTDNLAPAAESAWSERLLHEREGLVDRLARLITDLYYASI